MQGSAEGEAGLAAAHALMSRAYATHGASVHWYDKADVVPKRKIGHVNITAPTRAEARRRLDAVADGASARLGGPKGVAPEVGIIMGSDSDLPTMGLAAQVRCACWACWVDRGRGRAAGLRMPVVAAVWFGGVMTGAIRPLSRFVGMSCDAPVWLDMNVPHRWCRERRLVADRSRTSFRVGLGAPDTCFADTCPGWAGTCITLKRAMQVLADFDVACEVTVVSAHRTPERMFEYARSAHTRGIKVRWPTPPSPPLPPGIRLGNGFTSASAGGSIRRGIALV